MNNRSFTLIELLVVIAIVGILSGVVLVSSIGAVNSANDSKLKYNITGLVKAIIAAKGSGNFVIKSCEIGNGCTELENILIPTYYSSTSSIPRNSDGTYIRYSSTDGANFMVRGILSNGNSYMYDYELGFMDNPSNIAHQDFGGTCTVSIACNSGSCWGVANQTNSYCYVTADSQTTLTRTWTELKYRL